MNTEILQVAAGVVVNSDGNILLAKRSLHKHQGGLWEFPGGKVEAGESVHAALARELEEEVGITIADSEMLIQVQHAYADKTVCLNVLRVESFSGEAWGREGQEIAWVSPADLTRLPFPAANQPIVAAVRLPRRLLITGAFGSEAEFRELLRRALRYPVGMVQFRAAWLGRQEYIHLAQTAQSLCREFNVPLVANCAYDTFLATCCDGLHLTSSRLRQTAVRPVSQSLWLSAACHNLDDVRHAEAIGADFVSLSPVRPTDTHRDQAAMGWEQFIRTVQLARLPVYALGGMRDEDLARATAGGAQGIAAIREFWR